MQMFLSCVRRRSVSYRGVTCVGEQAGMFNARALGQSAQAEQDTLILYSSQESVIASEGMISEISNFVQDCAAELSW